jgi:hypothetical protein
MGLALANRTYAEPVFRKTTFLDDKLYVKQAITRCPRRTFTERPRDVGLGCRSRERESSRLGVASEGTAWGR